MNTHPDPLSSLFWCLETFHWKEWPRNSNYHPLILFCFPSLRFFSGTHFIDHIVLLSIKFLFLSTSMAPKHSNAALLPNYFDWSRFALRFQPKISKWLNDILWCWHKTATIRGAKAQWTCLRLPSFSPWFEYQAHHLCFSCVLYLSKLRKGQK